MIRRPPGRLGSDPIEPQAREVEFLNKGVDRPNRIALIDPVRQALGKQRRLPAIDPLNEAPHLIPPQIAAESYSANQIIQCVFTQPGSKAERLGMRKCCPLCPRKRAFRPARFFNEHALVWRFGSPHHFFSESEMRASEPKPH